MRYDPSDRGCIWKIVMHMGSASTCETNSLLHEASAVLSHRGLQESSNFGSSLRRFAASDAQIFRQLARRQAAPADNRHREVQRCPGCAKFVGSCVGSCAAHTTMLYANAQYEATKHDQQNSRWHEDLQWAWFGFNGTFSTISLYHAFKVDFRKF